MNKRQQRVVDDLKQTKADRARLERELKRVDDRQRRLFVTGRTYGVDNDAMAVAAGMKAVTVRKWQARRTPATS